MLLFVLDAFDLIKRFLGGIGENITDELIPRMKIVFLYPLAKFGFVKAQLSIADILFNRYWFWEPKNPERWVEKGIEQNNPFAIVLKGHFCRYKARQIEDETSPVEEKYAGEFVANLNNPDYVPDLTYEIERERIFKDREKRSIPLFIEAFECYRKAAEMNYALGQFYYFEFWDNYQYMLNLRTSCKKYLKLAAENGCPNAQGLFAQKCLEHDDLKQGLYWMKKAAKSKRKEWVKDEGFCFDRNDVRKWYRKNKNIIQIKKAALKGKPKALYDYSEYIMHDSHKQESLQLGHLWHTKAAQAGYPKAMEEEGSFIIHGWVNGKLEDAFNYYSRAFDAGCKIASWGLGDCYYYGWGTKRDFDKAKYYYRIAKRCGVGINMKALKKMSLEDFEKVDCMKALENDREFYN